MEYCERCGPGLFDEPFNALTNLAFLLAAWAAWRLARGAGRLTLGVGTLVALAACVGVGSGLWHTFATPWAEALDRIPILLFQLAFLWTYLRAVVGLPRRDAAGILVGFVLVCLVSLRLPDVLNRSLLYAPALLMAFGLGVYHWRARKREPFLLLAATAAFLIALVFRTIDPAVCPYFPRGTHFLWHLLNGANVYLAMRAVIVNLGPAEAAEAGRVERL